MEYTLTNVACEISFVSSCDIVDAFDKKKGHSIFIFNAWTKLDLIKWDLKKMRI